MTDGLLQLVRAADPLARHSGSALTADPDSVLHGILDRLTPPAKRRSRRTVFVASVAAAALVAAGVAIADGINPFAGIGAANHPQTTQDVLDPASATLIQHFNATAARQAAHTGLPAETLLPNTARLVGRLPSGRRFYVLSTTSNWLCVLTAPSGTSSDNTASIGCGDPLSQTKPTTVETQDRVVNGPDATPPLSFGVARDGVVAVSFMGGGTEQTVPVQDNVWAYEGHNSALESITVHYADGTTQTINH